MIAIDFNEIAHDTPDVLRSDLGEYLTNIGGDQIVPQGVSVVLMFSELIRGFNQRTGMPVVVLIDEYDKPIIEHLGKGEEELEIAIANRDVLRGFFGVLKGLNVIPALRFVLLTGVSQFSKVSVFSELNNLNDISMHGAYADMLGYTQEEFASIPYDIAAQRDEAYFHTIFYLMLTASGGAAQSSVLTCGGRIDLVVTFPDKIYIIELKCDQSAETGVKQVWERGYVEKYRQRGKKIVLLGINFSTEKRNLEAWEVEEVER